MELFRIEGFDKTTMRDIAASAGVASGAAYHYFESKEAIVQAFYAMASAAMQPRLEAAVGAEKGFEKKLRALLRTKMEYFHPFRAVLRVLLRNGADPAHPLSPFSEQTKPLRDTDIAWFSRIVADGGVAVPKDLAPNLPAVLWLYQAGVIFFWLTDTSEGQARTQKLVDVSTKALTQLVKLSSLPVARPVRKAAIDLIETVRSRAENPQPVN